MQFDITWELLQKGWDLMYAQPWLWVIVAILIVVVVIWLAAFTRGNLSKLLGGTAKQDVLPSATTGAVGTSYNITAGRGGDALAPDSTGGRGGDINFRAPDGISGGGSEMLEEQPTTIEDTTIELNAKNSDRATGMEITSPTELRNVKVNMTAENVRNATGMRVTSTNAEFAVGLKTVLCSCGQVLRRVTTHGYKPTIKCPKCGKEYAD